MNWTDTDIIFFFYFLSFKKSAHRGWARQMCPCCRWKNKREYIWTGHTQLDSRTSHSSSAPQIPLTPFMYDQVAPVYWIMKQVIKVTDVRPSILPGPLYNAAIRLLCPNLAHQMASFMVNWHCAVYRAKIEEHFTSSTFRFTQLIWQWQWQHKMYFLNLHLSFLHPSNYLLSHSNHGCFQGQVPRVVFGYRINKII